MIYSLFGRSGNRIPRWSGRRLRRVLTVGALLCFALIWLLAATPSSGSWPHIVVLVGLPTLMRVLEVSTADVIYRRGEFLDERQRSLRDYAFCLSLRFIQILLFGLTAWGVVVAFTSGFRTVLFGPMYPVAFLITLYTLVWAAPTLIMAWLEPDTVRDD